MHSPAPDADVEAADQPVLVLREAAVPDVGPEVVEPPEPAALAAPVQPYKPAKGLTIPSSVHNLIESLDSLLQLRLGR